jgi:hypothetical protein
MSTTYEYHECITNFIFVFHCKLLTSHLRFVFILHFLLYSYIGPCFTTKREHDGVGGSKVGV